MATATTATRSNDDLAAAILSELPDASKFYGPFTDGDVTSAARRTIAKHVPYLYKFGPRGQEALRRCCDFAQQPFLADELWGAWKQILRDQEHVAQSKSVVGDAARAEKENRELAEKLEVLRQIHAEAVDALTLARRELEAYRNAEARLKAAKSSGPFKGMLK